MTSPIIQTLSLFRQLSDPKAAGYEGAVAFIQAVQNVKRPLLDRGTHAYTLYGYTDGPAMIIWYGCEHKKTGRDIGIPTPFDLIDANLLDSVMADHREFLIDLISK